MKKFLVVFSLLLIVGTVLGCLGCAGSQSSTTTSFVKYGTIQGKVMDAITGAAIGGDDLKMYLIQGTDNRQPDKLITDTNDALVGEYAFSKIPVELYNYDVNDITFKVVVIKAGYQPFEADVCIATTFAERNIGAGVETDLWITNEVFNQIGNIYLYPLGSSAGNVTVCVYSPSPLNRPIANATVLLRQNVNNNSITLTSGDRLAATAGLYPSLTAITDSSGQAMFSSADLTLGGSYSVVVEALTFEGQQLATTTNGPFCTGVNPTTRVVNMSPIGDSLFVTSASNSLPGTITSNGVLTITFNQPILLSNVAFTATMTGNGTVSPQTVNAVLSDDHMKLTLTPVITTPPNGKGAIITYAWNGATIYLQNSQTATSYTLFTGGNAVKNINTGLAVSGVVLMTSN